MTQNEEERKNATPYGFANTSGELDSSIATLAGILPQLMRLAELEKAVYLLADER